MNRVPPILFFLISSLCLNPVIAYEIYGPPKEVHEALTKLSYRSGIRKAVAELLKDSPLKRTNTSKSLQNILKTLESFYGDARGHEVLKVKYISRNVCRVYGVLNFEKGPAYFSIDFYLSKDDWIVVDIEIAFKPQDILPKRLYQ